MNAPELQQLAAQLLMGANTPDAAALDPANTPPPVSPLDAGVAPPAVAPVAVASAMPAPLVPVPTQAVANAPVNGTVTANVQQSMPVPASPEQIKAAQEAARTTAGDGLPLTPQQQATRHAGVVAQELPAMDQNAAGKFSHNREDQAAATDEQKDAALAQAVAQSQVEHAKDSGLPEMANIIEDDLRAKQKFETWKLDQTQQIMDASTFVRDQSLKLAQEDPTNLWSNATTGGKIAGIIGIVASGLSHPGGAMQRVNQMVNDAVNDQARRAKYLGQYGEAANNLYANAEKVYASREAAHESVKGALIAQVENKVQQAIAATKDPMIIANLQTTLAGLSQQRVAADQKSMQIEMGLRSGLAAQTAGLEKTQMMANARAQSGQNRAVFIPGLVNEDGTEAALDGKSPTIRKLQGAMSNVAAFISRGEKIKAVLAEARKAGKASPRYEALLAKYNALAQNLQGPYKEFYNYGAAFTGGEKAPLLSMLSALPTQALNFDFLNDISDAKLNTGISIIKDDARKVAVGLSGNTHVHLDLTHPFYQPEPDDDETPALTQTASKPNSADPKAWNTILGNMPEQ